VKEKLYANLASLLYLTLLGIVVVLLIPLWIVLFVIGQRWRFKREGGIDGKNNTTSSVSATSG